MKTENKEFFKINLLLKDILIKYISLRDIKIGKHLKKKKLNGQQQFL